MARYPERPVVGVGALVLRSGEILLVKRKYPPGRGLWSIPGGHVNLGEGILEAAVRELEEETGIRGVPLGVVNVDNAIIRDDEGRVKYHYLLVTVLVKPEGGRLRAASDALDAGFFPLDEAKGLPLTDSVRGLIEKIERGLLPLDRPCPVRTYSPDYGED